MTGRPLKIAIVAGEESGDLLGANLVEALRRQSGREIELVGIGGRHLEAAGLRSFFDPAEISLVGISAILLKLPRLFGLIRQTARRIVREKPDCLVTIDVPDFSLRVTRRVRAADPAIPIVHYVCPSIWAWRPQRAAAMKPHVDHVLCLLPFEPDALQRLGGPKGSFVGHRLGQDPKIRAIAATRAERGPAVPGDIKTLLVLPGSRRGEIRRMIEPFGQTVEILVGRGHDFRILIPTLPHLVPTVEALTGSWKVRPQISSDPDAKWKAYAEADAALAKSGTVTLELALAHVPTVAGYRADALMTFLLLHVVGVTTWSVLLPNIVADKPVVTELLADFFRPDTLVRHVEQLWKESPYRAAQQAGFDDVTAAMALDRPSGEIAAEIVLAQALKD